MKAMFKFESEDKGEVKEEGKAEEGEEEKEAEKKEEDTEMAEKEEEEEEKEEPEVKGEESNEEAEEVSKKAKRGRKGSSKKAAKDEKAAKSEPGSKELVTPIERPIKERKTVERYSEPSTGRSASKALSIEKGQGTQLKDMPNGMLVIGVFVQVLCSYSTLPLYAIVTQVFQRFP
ncbi:hypothetical protein LOK49_LG08G00310 [Camellia lanceoleosa]|uniref:Uncharacterized protein n=1 Tax=Camellia lanceoleosa TaxID=1840588 RepID=A0ACC0GWH0_9ERIC|nr:hypothetical protein LOK49_LG08G00310 [Camellia lanceoleosa]